MTGAAVLLALGLGMPAFSLVDRLVFHPTPGVDLEPAELGIHAEEVFIEAEDGTRIHAFVLPHEGATRAFLFLHGNAGNASHRLPNAALLQRMGATVLLLDYRGYGRSEGRPTEAGVYADARAGLGYLVGRLGFAEERVVVFGRSLGGAVAVELARDRPLAGVILESTFTSFQAMVRQIVGTGFGRLTCGRFDALAKIGEVRAPLYFFHGDRDEVVPYAFGQELYEAAPEPKHFTAIPGAGHNDTVQVGGPRYLERIAGFLEEVAPSRQVESSP